MKKIIDEIGLDLETICVDPSEVRDRLLEDDEYGIEEVPSVLVIYSNGKHKVYAGKGLDNWFQQLLENIQQYRTKQQSPQAVTLDSTPITEIPMDTQPMPMDTQPMPVPEEMPEESSILSGDSGMSGGPGNVSGARASMIAEHIKAAEPLIPISEMDKQEPSKPAPKAIKSGGLSPVELAKKMAKEKELLDEKIDRDRPFI